jgi:hypothetical protein
MLVPSVSITLNQKKKLIRDVKAAGVHVHERKEVARAFLRDNGVKGETVVVEVLDKSGEVKAKMKGETEVLKWAVRVASNGNQKRRVSHSMDSPQKRGNRGSK